MSETPSPALDTRADELRHVLQSLRDDNPLGYAGFLLMLDAIGSGRPIAAVRRYRETCEACQAPADREAAKAIRKIALRVRRQEASA